MTEGNYQILKNEIHLFQEVINFQMKKILLKIILSIKSKDILNEVMKELNNRILLLVLNERGDIFL